MDFRVGGREQQDVVTTFDAVYHDILTRAYTYNACAEPRVSVSLATLQKPPASA